MSNSDDSSSRMEKTYIPALRFDRLTAFYDPLIRWTLREATFKTRLIRQAHLEEGHRVLDALPKKDFLPIYIDLYPTDGMGAFVRTAAKAITEAAASRADKLAVRHYLT